MSIERLVADLLDPPEWEPQGRKPLKPHQAPPPTTTGWTVWILRGGRGAGKTEGGARYFAKHMRRHPGHRGRIIGPTLGDVVESCIDGPSGLRAQDPDVRFIPSAPGGAKVVWPNGSEALLIGTPTPRDVERLRAAGNRHIDWWEEAGANPQFGPAWDQAALGLRLGQRPHSIITTTPRNRPKLRELMKKAGTVMTHGTMYDNADNLAPAFIEEMERQYAGTRLGRQELQGELLDDVPGALWTRELVERAITQCPDLAAVALTRVVVSVDPAASSGEESDETGIVVAGRDAAGRGYVLEDATVAMASPDEWGRRAVRALDQHAADRIVAEVNNGGEMVEAVIRTVRRTVPYRAVHASRGKRVRAEPVAALYEQGRVFHAGVFPRLEDQLCNWTPDAGDSPDRLDALVWAITALDLHRPTGRRDGPEKERERTSTVTAGMRERSW